MNVLQAIAFTIPISLIASGFVIGGRDGAIFSLVGSVALVAVTIWGVTRIARKEFSSSNQVPKKNKDNSN
jgi:hypothetical protein